MRALSSAATPAGTVLRELATGVALVNAPAPMLAPGHALISVDAAGINRADALQLYGAYPPPPGVTQVPGLEVAGRIMSAEPAANRTYPFDVSYAYQQDTPVVALLPGGGLAEFAAADMRLVLPMPPGHNALQVVSGTDPAIPPTLRPTPCEDVVRGAALVEACAAAWLNLVILGKLRPGERLLIHGGSGAVGTIAIQLAAHIGAHVYATAGSPRRAALTRQLGATAAFDYHDDVVEGIREATSGKGVDLILDVTGAGGLDTNLQMLAPRGRLLLMGLQKGTRGNVNLATVLSKQLTITGATLRSAPIDLKARVVVDLVTTVWPLIEDNHIMPVIDTVYPVPTCGDAFARLAPRWFDKPAGTYADPNPFGKMVLRF